jgi:hypothetical protein
MGFFSNCIRSAANLAFVPVELVKDAATLGGVLTGDNESTPTDGSFLPDTFTGKRMSRVIDRLEDALKAID